MTTRGTVLEVAAWAILLWIAITLIGQRSAVARWLGWSAAAAWAYLSFASPLGHRVWATLGTWSTAAMGYLAQGTAAVGRGMGGTA